MQQKIGQVFFLEECNENLCLFSSQFVMQTQRTEASLLSNTPVFPHHRFGITCSIVSPKDSFAIVNLSTLLLWEKDILWNQQ